MHKVALILSIATLVWSGDFTAASAQQTRSGVRSQVFNPFSIRPSVERRFSLRGFTSLRTNPFAVTPIVETAGVPELTVATATPRESLSASDEETEVDLPPAFGGGGRPPYEPPVRSPFRPPPRPPLGP